MPGPPRIDEAGSGKALTMTAIAPDLSWSLGLPPAGRSDGAAAMTR